MWFERSLILFCLLISCFSYTKASDTIIISNESLNTEHFFIGQYLDLLEDKEGKLSFEEVIQPNNQERFFEDTIRVAGNYNFNSYYWGRFTLLNQSERSEGWVMEFYDFKIDCFELYIPIHNGGFIKKTGGDQYSYNNKDYQHKNYVFTIPEIPQKKPLTVFFRISTSDPIAIIGVVRTHERFLQYATMEYYLLALFYGILLSVFLYNLFLYIAVKEKAHLFLALYILCFGLYTTCMDGTGFQFMWPEFPQINKYASHFFQLLIMVSILLYAKTFLLTKSTIPAFNKCLKYLIIFRVMLFLLALLMPNKFLYKVTYYYDFTTTFVFFIAGIYSYYILKYRPALLYMIAFAFFFTGFFISMLHVLRWFDAGVYVTAYAYNAGVLLQIFFLSLSVHDRIQLLMKEKDELKDHAKQELEEKVNERTLELQEKNRLLDSFVYKASHDIKGPLKSIIGLTSVALKDKDPNNSEEYFTHILKSTKRLDTLLHDLLDLTKMQQEVPLCISDIEIEPLLVDIYTAFENVEGIELFSFEIINEYQAIVASDMKIIRSILQNMLENAIKYRDINKTQSYLKVYISFCKQGVEFQFKDNGVGIPLQYQEKIFEMFAKVNELSNGFGLGLHIVKLAVDKLGGNIQIKSKVNEGTIFTIQLPNQNFIAENP